MYDEYPFSIVASRGANGVNEGLVVLYQIVCGSLILGIGLVESCEEQMLIVVDEGIGNLSPQGRQYLFVLLDGGGIAVLDVVFEPSAVPVVVEHHIETVVDAIVDHFLDASHPFAVNLVGRGIADMSESPGARDSDALEAEALDVVDECLGGLRALPGGLGLESALVVQEVCTFPCCHSLERVAEVPARSHFVNHIGSLAIEALGAHLHVSH